MPLRVDDIRHIARLARLKLTDDTLRRYGEQLSSILDYVDTLNTEEIVQKGECAPTSSKSVQDMRIDEISCIPGLTTRKTLLSQSSMRDNDFLKVPGVFVMNHESETHE